MTTRLRAGRQIGPYRLTDRIFSGATSSVWRAEDQWTGRRVILKLLASSCRQSRSCQQRQTHEAQVLKLLADVPDICHLIDYGRNELGAFLVLEEVPGQDLSDAGRLTFATACSIVSGVLKTLEAVHGRGIVHGDIKPGNVMYCRGKVTLLDFSSSFCLHKSRRYTPDIGTIGYCAPEQFSGKVDARADLFAAACLLWDLLNGWSIFWAGSDELVRQKVRAGWRKPHHWPRYLPRELEHFFAVALARRPDDRFGSAREMRLALEAIVLRRGIPAPRQPTG